jgi:hypothetical protein
MKQTIKVINELKRKGLFKDYAIGGGIATLFYVEPFLTYDLDVFIIPSEERKKTNLIMLTPIFKYFKNKGYRFRGEHLIVEGIPVQFIPADELEEEAVNGARQIQYEGVKTKVMTPEYLVAILLRAGRKKDIEKIERLLEQARIDKKQLEDILRRYDLSQKLKLLKGRSG